MTIQIIDNKKLNWSYVNKVTVKITDKSFNYEAPLSISEISKIYFCFGKILEDFYNEKGR